MPTVLRLGGFRFFFYSNEGNESAHIHVQYQKGVAKFWLSPVSLASNHGLNAKEINKAIKIVREHAKQMEDKWNEYFSN
jgi:hypothetical protein